MERRVCLPPFEAYEVDEEGHVYRRRDGREIQIHLGIRPFVMLALPGGMKRTTAAGRLICGAWHGPAPTPAHRAMYISGDLANWQPANLRWATQEEINRASWARGRARRYRVVLKGGKLARVMQMARDGASLWQMSKKAGGVDIATIYRRVRREGIKLEGERDPLARARARDRAIVDLLTPEPKRYKLAELGAKFGGVGPDAVSQSIRRLVGAGLVVCGGFDPRGHLLSRAV